MAIASFLAALALFAAVRSVGVGEEGPWDELLALGTVVVVSALVWASMVFLASATRGPGWPGFMLGTAAYMAVGFLFALAGIPGYVGPGFHPLLLPFWPFYAIWLHACPTGVGLWPCPPG